MAGSMTGVTIPAPGAMVSPHAPGAIPDWTTVPTHVGEPIPPAAAKIRPLSEYGSAEEISGVFHKKPMDELQAGDFEQAPATLEEMRKVDPANLPPTRPFSERGRDPEIAAGAATRQLSPGE